MNNHDFSEALFSLVGEYVSLSSNLCETLIALKKALLSFDNAKLNRILDEKLVLNEQILSVNANLESLIISRYGEFSNLISKQLLLDFPEIKLSWDALRSMMKLLKSHASDVRRIIRAIEKYHADMKVTLEGAKPKLYKQYIGKGG